MGETCEDRPISVTNESLSNWLCPKSPNERYTLFREIGLQLEEEGLEHETISNNYKQLSKATFVNLKIFTPEEISFLTRIKFEKSNFNPEDVKSNDDSEETDKDAEKTCEKIHQPCTSSVMSLQEDESKPVLLSEEKIEERRATSETEDIEDCKQPNKYEDPFNTRRISVEDCSLLLPSGVSHLQDDEASIEILLSEDEEKHLKTKSGDSELFKQLISRFNNNTTLVKENILLLTPAVSSLQYDMELSESSLPKDENHLKTMSGIGAHCNHLSESKKSCNTNKTLIEDCCSSPMSIVNCLQDGEGSIETVLSEDEKHLKSALENGVRCKKLDECEMGRKTHRTSVEGPCLLPTTTVKCLENNEEHTEIKLSKVEEEEKQVQNNSKDDVNCKKPDEDIIEVSSVYILDKGCTNTSVKKNESHIIRNKAYNDQKTDQPNQIPELNVNKREGRENMRQHEEVECSKRKNIDTELPSSERNTNNEIEINLDHPMNNSVPALPCSKDNNIIGPKLPNCEVDTGNSINENIITENMSNKEVSDLHGNKYERTLNSTKEPCAVKEPNLNKNTVLNIKEPTVLMKQNVHTLEQKIIEPLISVRKNLLSDKTISDEAMNKKKLNVLEQTHGPEENDLTNTNYNCEKGLDSKGKNLEKECLILAEASDSPQNTQPILIESDIVTESEEECLKSSGDNTESQSDEPEIDTAELIDKRIFCKTWPINIENNQEHSKEAKSNGVNKSYSDGLKESVREFNSQVKMIDKHLAAKRSSNFPEEHLTKSKIRKLSADHSDRPEIIVNNRLNKQMSCDVTKVSETRSQLPPIIQLKTNNQQTTSQCSNTQQMKVVITQQNSNQSEPIVNNQRRMSSEMNMNSSLIEKKSAEYNVQHSNTLQHNERNQMPGIPVNRFPQATNTAEAISHSAKAAKSYDNPVPHLTTFTVQLKQVAQVHNNRSSQDIQTSQSLVQEQNQCLINNTLMGKGQTHPNLQTTLQQDEQMSIESPARNEPLSPQQKSRIQNAVSLFLSSFGNLNSQPQSIIPHDIQSSLMQYSILKGRGTDLLVRDYMSLYLLLYTEYFSESPEETESVNVQIFKICEILHLAVADCIRLNDRKTRALRLTTATIRKDEINRGEADYQEMLNCRGSTFRELFFKVLSRFEDCEYTMFFALYYRIIQQLLTIDPGHVKYIRWIPSIISKLIESSKFEMPVIIRNIFDALSGESLMTSYIFIKKCLVTYCIAGYCGPEAGSILKLSHLDPFPIHSELVLEGFTSNQNETAQHSTGIESGHISQGNNITNRTATTCPTPQQTSSSNMAEGSSLIGPQHKMRLDTSTCTAVQAAHVSQGTGTINRTTTTGLPPQKTSSENLVKELQRCIGAQQKMRMDALTSKHVAEPYIERNVNRGQNIHHTQAPNQPNIKEVRIHTFSEQNRDQATTEEMRMLGHRQTNQAHFQQQMVQGSPPTNTRILQQMLQTQASNVNKHQRNGESSNVQNVQSYPVQNTFKINTPQQQQMIMQQRTGANPVYQNARSAPNFTVNISSPFCRPPPPPYLRSMQHRLPHNPSERFNQQPWQGMVPQSRFSFRSPIRSFRHPVQNQQPTTSSTPATANNWRSDRLNSPKTGIHGPFASSSQSQDRDLHNLSNNERVDIPSCFNGCGTTATLVCSLCKQACYCNIECQTSDWYNKHSRECGRK